MKSKEWICAVGGLLSVSIILSWMNLDMWSGWDITAKLISFDDKWPRACKVLRGLGLKVCISVRRVGQRTFQNPKDISKLISGNKNLPISESKCWSQAPLCRITIHGYRRNSKMTILQGVWRPYVRNQSLHLKSVLNWPRMVKKLEQNCNAYLLWVSAAAGLLLYIFSTVWRNELKFEDIWQVLWI